jgi:hypothetical protein
MNPSFRVTTLAFLGLLVVSGIAQVSEPMFTFTSSDGKLKYVGHFEAEGDIRGKGVIEIIDGGDNMVSVPIQKIDSIVLTPRKDRPPECRYYSNKVVVTFLDGTTVEGCFGPRKINLVTATVTVQHVGSLNGRLVRKKE